MEFHNRFLYAIREEDRENLCKKRNYHILTPDGRSVYSNETADDLTAEGYTILDSASFNKLWKEQWAIYEKEICGKWIEVSEQTYNDALNVLPPLDWRNGGFFISELYTGNISNFYQKHFGKFYTSLQNINRNRNEIIDELNACIKSGTVAHESEEPQ